MNVYSKSQPIENALEEVQKMRTHEHLSNCTFHFGEDALGRETFTLTMSLMREIPGCPNPAADILNLRGYTTNYMHLRKLHEMVSEEYWRQAENDGYHP